MCERKIEREREREREKERDGDQECGRVKEKSRGESNTIRLPDTQIANRHVTNEEAATRGEGRTQQEREREREELRPSADGL